MEGLAPGTMESYLAAVRYEQIRRGLGDPEIYKMPRVEYVIKGAKRAKPGVVRRRLPITPAILEKLREIWNITRAPEMQRCCGPLAAFVFWGFYSRARW